MLAMPTAEPTAASVRGGRPLREIVRQPGFATTVFSGAVASREPLIAKMAIDEQITASILGASTKSIGDKAYGNMLLGLPDDDDVVKRAISYLSSIPDVLVEEVTGDVR